MLMLNHLLNLTKMNKHLILLFVAFGMAVHSQAQVPRTGTEDTLKTRIITVFDYKPTISDAKKLSMVPMVIDTALSKPEATYLFDTRLFNTTYVPDSINAAKMKGEPLDPLYRGYVKGGLGNGINYMLDAYVNSLRSREGELGVELHGKGTQGVLLDLPPANYNHWRTAISGKKFFKKHALSGKVGFDRERIQYYGYDYNDTLVAPLYLDYQGNEDVFKQVYNELFADVALKSFYTDSNKLNHDLKLHYDYFSDKNGSNFEHNIVFNAIGSRYFGNLLGSIDFITDLNNVNYVNDFYFSPFDTIASSITNTILGLTPKITSQYQKLRIELGVKAQMDLRADATTLRLYPDIYLKYNLVKELIIPYAGITGGLQRNNLNNLTETNPFLWPALMPLQNTDREFHVSGGFRGSVSQRFTYNLCGGYYRERNAPLFVNYNASQFNPNITPFGVNYFTLVYDTLTVTEFGGEMTYRIVEKLHFVAAGVFRDFQTKREVEAWQRPNFEISASGFYQLRNKIIVKAELHLLGPQYAKRYKDYIVDDTEAVGTEFINDQPISVVSDRIKPIVDANVGLEYRYTERLSGFLSLNNLLIQRYQRWNNYPVQRFNVMAGLTYSFWKE
jgi:hypothetical protein